MKRFWLVMLSLGLVLAFSASAMAVDVKFSGSFYAAGMYLDKTTLQNSAAKSASDNVSTAFYYQRLRVQTDFIVSPGISLVTRFNAMERAWGAPRSSATTSDANYLGRTNETATGSAGTVAENENIAFDLAYVQWVSPVGIWQVGYVADGKWGTQFGDNDTEMGKIQWILPVGPAVFSFYVGKNGEFSKTAKFNSTSFAGAEGVQTDVDSDSYVATATYNVNKDISLGLLYAFKRIAAYKQAYTPLAAFGFNSAAVLAKAHVINPYAKAKIGPVALEAEFNYVFGKGEYENNLAGISDVKIAMMSAYLGAMVDLGPVYFGAKGAYMSGDDPATTDKWEGGQVGGGLDWNPTLIMFNRERTKWAGALPGYGSTSPKYTNGPDAEQGLFGGIGMSNAWFGQAVVGGRPMDALDIQGSVAYAKADQRPTGYLNADYCWEIDVTGTYKITNNLSYMLGFAYFLTGDYYKYNNNDNKLRNDYLLINKLTLTF
ncbi:MAG: hypothetical protein WCO53_02640 [Deltaproteobacteria bacterium]